MGQQRLPLQIGETVPAFTLPAANRDGMVSRADLAGRPFLIGFYRGLHCPFCRRQVVQLGVAQPALRTAGIETVAVINTPVERAKLYFRHRPTPIMLLSDPDCLTHRAFGVPRLDFLPEGSNEEAKWPYRASMADFMTSRINPTGELAAPTFPMEANTALNAKDGFQMEEADNAILATHPTQLVGHFLVDAAGAVRWLQIEAPDGPNSISTFPTAEQLIAAVDTLVH
ncbi:MAG: redoxin domain-containing protein [Betaproteobacteria bacterium]